MLVTGEQMAEALLEQESLEIDEEEVPELSIPDLEGDMLFSLEDPLDAELEPDVTIEPLDEDEDKEERLK